MSRIAKRPVKIAENVSVEVQGSSLTVKGPKGSLSMTINDTVEVNREDGLVSVAARSAGQFSRAMSGTTRALINNMVRGVSDGFERKLELVGVGYRAQVQGKKLNLTLGFSHPVEYGIPDGITIETPSQSEILIKGIDRQQVGQVAAELRELRPPEPYKGKGVRYSDERIVMKEAKKK
jgi:large subunit ribosomal protein L6